MTARLDRDMCDATNLAGCEEGYHGSAGLSVRYVYRLALPDDARGTTAPAAGEDLRLLHVSTTATVRTLA